MINLKNLRIGSRFYNFRASAPQCFIIYKNFRFFICVICAICGFIFSSPHIFAMGEASKFTFAQLEYSGVGPNGCVSIVDPQAVRKTASDNVDAHTKTNCLLHHHAALDANGKFVKADERIDTTDEPDHQELCNREQRYFLQALREDLDLTEHLQDAINSLRIVLAADESVRTGRVVKL